MAYPDSGTIACDTVAAKAERCARLAHQLAKLDPDEPRGAAEVLLCMLKIQTFDFVDVGVPPARAHVVFGVRPSEPESGEWPLAVRMLRRQRPERLREACAYACAKIVAWARREQWSDAFERAVAGAIMIPGPKLLGPARHLSPPEIAVGFGVDVSVAVERLALLRGAYGSGERQAMDIDRS